ncbi:leukocyte cysteine proteinase inhibitor 1-like [Pimephales promelas]|uniref:leukocyte cysteine proteinase inhibitor 1-like n=1 Tax=Pimephales promelas TaxID=90988 RepID=UPI001955B658|nr:leukocyte cysteine proteinase inhibitor 1-like [Pimephales promelas]KAG1931583.1 hypothetical protein F2P79_021496 [Pimephales promelas]
MPTTVLGLLGVLLCALAVTSQVTPQKDLKRFFTETTGESVAGEWSPLIVTEDVEKILYEVKPDIEKAVGTHFHVFIPISHRFQIEEGINYVVMVYTGGNTCVYAMISQAFPWHGGELSVPEVLYPEPCIDWSPSQHF